MRGGHLVERGDGDAAREQRIVRVLCCKVSRRLCGEEVELRSPDLVVRPIDDLSPRESGWRENAKWEGGGPWAPAGVVI